jgi:hypothetical protein
MGSVRAEMSTTDLIKSELGIGTYRNGRIVRKAAGMKLDHNETWMIIERDTADGTGRERFGVVALWERRDGYSTVKLVSWSAGPNGMIPPALHDLLDTVPMDEHDTPEWRAKSLRCIYHTDSVPGVTYVHQLYGKLTRTASTGEPRFTVDGSGLVYRLPKGSVHLLTPVPN